MSRLVWHAANSFAVSNFTSRFTRRSGDLFAVGGLEKVVRVFDIRKFSKKAWDGKKPSKQQKPVAFRAYGGSINSAFFSPSGGHLLTTCMNDTLTLTPRSALSGSEFCVGQTIQVRSEGREERKTRVCARRKRREE